MAGADPPIACPIRLGGDGLNIADRESLKSLIDDVRNGHIDFTAILVCDISRWARFQDADESGCYVFVCREAGITVHYCAEPFENDASPGSMIMKIDLPLVRRTLKSVSGRSLWFIPSRLSTTTPPPGTDKPVVTQLLRAMLYVHAVPAQSSQLRQAIERQSPEINDIAIRAKLFSLIGQVREKPWAFPVCINTQLCRQLYKELRPIVDASETAADFMSDPVSPPAAGAASAAVTSRMGAATAANLAKGFAIGTFALSLTNFFAGKSKDYYEYYTKRISDELALQGIPPSSP